ncbi:MAG: SMI1/KNR4 family protein [Clostridia bacterium]|nr:SMI1/KNR4 family protein [Clostridia bacterium]
MEEKRSLAQQYIDGLRNAYLRAGDLSAEEWIHFEGVKQGISAADEMALLKKYPEMPASLVELLEFADGTYWRQYGEEKIAFYFLGSDVDEGEYPYYLYSAAQLIEDDDMNYGDNFADLFEWYRDEMEAAGTDIFVDPRIRQDGSRCDWLCFSDCINNGGTSRLFIDFTPAKGGRKGQIIRYLHDPDRLDVIADSFDEYLMMLMDKNYAFIQPEFF